MINPKKATRHVNNTLSGSMYTPASILGEFGCDPAIQEIVDPIGCPLPKKTPGTIESAKAAVITAIAMTK
jgi:hypothetical protein